MSPLLNRQIQNLENTSKNTSWVMKLRYLQYQEVKHNQRQKERIAFLSKFARQNCHRIIIFINLVYFDFFFYSDILFVRSGSAYILVSASFIRVLWDITWKNMLHGRLMWKKNFMFNELNVSNIVEVIPADLICCWVRLVLCRKCKQIIAHGERPSDATSCGESLKML